MNEQSGGVGGCAQRELEIKADNDLDVELKLMGGHLERVACASGGVVLVVV